MAMNVALSSLFFSQKITNFYHFKVFLVQHQFLIILRCTFSWLKNTQVGNKIFEKKVSCYTYTFKIYQHFKIVNLIANHALKPVTIVLIISHLKKIFHKTVTARTQSYL